MGPKELSGAAALLGLLIVVAGCWQLMRTLRTRPSRFLFVSLVSLIVWVLISDTITRVIFFYTDLSNPQTWANWALLSVEFFVPSVLVLIAAVCFWIVARSLPLPN